MARRVLEQLDELRAALAATPAAHAAAVSPGSSSAPALGSWSTTPPVLPALLSGAPHGPGSAGRLGAAVEAAECALEAAASRNADLWASTLRAKDNELADARRAAAAAAAEVARLQSELAAARQGAATQAQALEARLAACEAELSSLGAELLAARAQRDDAEARCRQREQALAQQDEQLGQQAAQLGAALDAAAHDAEAAAAAAARERQHKERLMHELTELHGQLRAAHEEAAEAQRQGASEAQAREELQATLQRAAAAAAAVTEGKDLELAQLRQALRRERDLRKACEAWLSGELRSREEAAVLLAAVRDVAAGGSGSGQDAGRSVAQVEALLAAMSAPHDGEPPSPPRRADSTAQQPQQPQAQQPLGQQAQAQPPHGRRRGGAAGSLAGREFVAARAAMAEASGRLRAELAAAKSALRERVAAPGQGLAAGRE